MSSSKTERHDVVIVGAGPVGLVAALDLAYRGISALILERRTDEEPTHPRCNTTSARTMEFLRRIGCHETYRSAGLPPDYAADVVYVTRVNGDEITRLNIPGAGRRFEDDRFAHDGGWHSAERPHRSSQFYLERVLREQVRQSGLADLRYFSEVVGVDQDDDKVTLRYRDTRDGSESEVEARYVMACDGGGSYLRRELGIRMEGEYTGIGRTQSVFFRSPDLLSRFKVKPGWMNWCINAESFHCLIPIDGKELWLTHCMIPDGAEGVSEEEYDRQIRETAGCDIEYEVIEVEPWKFNRAVAERYRVGNVFLAGDSAHAWPAYAGHGMNSGIEDGVSLTWMLAAVLQGWASPAILDAYEAERHDIGDKISRVATGLARSQHEITQDMEARQKIEGDGPEAKKVRQDFRKRLLDIDSRQFNAQGLNFGLCYDKSPIILYDEGEAPALEVDKYTPSTVPGCRVPHFVFTETGEPILDRLGPGYSLLVTDDEIDYSGLVDAAAEHGVPLKVIDISFEPKAKPYYDYKLVLVRPDDRIAWRSNTAPADPKAIIATVRGAAMDASAGGAKSEELMA